MQFKPTAISGLFQIELPCYEDHRGSFVRVFHDETFQKWVGYPLIFKETFYSKSKFNVVRGLHFQLPPSTQDKLVYVIAGEINDVVLDLRKNSGTFGKHLSFRLSAENRAALFIPKGVAHGFASMSEECIVAYMISNVHDPANDTGIRWDSFGYDWNIDKPVISEKDKSLPAFESFNSPF